MAVLNVVGRDFETLRENFALIVPYYAEAFKLTEEECTALEVAAAERFQQKGARSSWAAVMCVVDAIDAFCSRRKMVAQPVPTASTNYPMRKAA